VRSGLDPERDRTAGFAQVRTSPVKVSDPRAWHVATNVPERIRIISRHCGYIPVVDEQGFTGD
jgi:hypothetical protein